jgi:serine protease Do
MQPFGFADMVAKVKPAVISVRVRLDAAKTASLEDNDGNNGRANPGGPFDRFFRQFGVPDGMPNGVEPRSRRGAAAEGSGFFVAADGYAPGGDR